MNIYVQNATLKVHKRVKIMGEVLLVYEIRPETTEITPKKLEEIVRLKLPEKVKMQNNPEEKPLFFGLVGIIGQFIIPEEDGAQDNLEDVLNSIEEISSIQMTFITRL
jgi:translation elongation factor aEF-1 beta